jgi:Poly A polymerase regulatory subunit
MILNLIYGLLVSIIVIITYIIAGCANMFKKQPKYGSALDMMSDILGGSEVTPLHESGFVLGGVSSAVDTPTDATTDATTDITHTLTPTPKFIIRDPKLKAEFTKNFMRVYNSPPRAPDIILDQLDSSLPYNTQQLYTSAYHIGQRKLILNEIQFLSKATNNGIVIYAGSAPSNKGAFLAHLFPRLRFIFIDPNKFDIVPYGEIEITHTAATNDTSPADLADEMLGAIVHSHICTANVYMTGGIAAEFGQRFAKGMFEELNIPGFASPINLYFISDIRTNIDDSFPTTFDLMWNSAQHINWVTKLSPTASMLKFRTPYFNETDEQLLEFEAKSQEEPFKGDFDAAAPYANLRTFTSRTFNYFDGEIFIQPWAPISSTESRLVFEGIPLARTYDPSDYENKFFYYNKILRAYQYYNNPNADKNLGFDHCADCALENQIWTEYCLSLGVIPTDIRKDVHFYVKTLSQLTFRPLLHDDHGKRFGKLPMNVIVEKFNSYSPKKKKQYRPK